MALLTTKSFLPYNSKQPTKLSLSKGIPTFSSAFLPSPLQWQPDSITFPTFCTSTHLPKCPTPSSKSRNPWPLIPSALPKDDSIPPSNQTDDPTPPILNEDEWGNDPKLPPTLNDDEGGRDPQARAESLQNNSPPGNVGSDSAEEGKPSEAIYVDEWGDKADPDELSAETRLPDADPPSMEEDEWSPVPTVSDETPVDSGLKDIKQSLVDSFYGTEYGLTASSQTRAEIGELVSQLEAQNPTPAPTEALSLLQGNWVLVYTSFSELLPIIAAGTLPFLRLGKVCQVIDTEKFTVENSASYIGPFATFSVGALASFEVRSPKRIEVKFEEGIIPPPKITSTLNIPETIEVFGQKINLSSFQGSLYPLQEAATRISQVISGQSPLKIPIGRAGPQSWLLITYLDEDLRISRGDGGGLFVLVKEGSPFLNL